MTSRSTVGSIAAVQFPIRSEAVIDQQIPSFSVRRSAVKWADRDT